MKNLIYLLVIFFAVSCSSNISDNKNVKPQKIFRSSNDYPTRWDKDVGDCITPSQNCTAPVIITPQKIGPYDNFIESIENGPNSIANFFTNGDWDDLFPNLDNDDLNNLKSGTYNIISVESGNIIYYLCGATGTLSTENVDFVLVVDVSEL